MGFRINTNIAAMNAHRNSVQTNLGLDKSLQALSSGLRINTAADDASGLSIANSLRAQSTGLGQAINNANDGIGVTQTADGALDEYENIINTVRTKAIQAASDGQNADSRMAIQRDISKLLEEADNIAKTTSFNGLNLLDGSYTDKNFQIGAYSNETVGISIDSARTTVVGQFALTTGAADVGTAAFALGDVTVNGVDIAASVAGSTTDNINALAQTSNSANAKMIAIDASFASTGVDATANTEVKGGLAVAGGTIGSTTGDVYLNGVSLGDVTFSANDATGTLTAAINKISEQTGITASISDGGKLTLTSEEGYNVVLSTDATGGTVASAAQTAKMFGTGSTVQTNNATAAGLTALEQGRITLESDNAIVVAGGNAAKSGITDATYGVANSISTADVTTYTAAQLTIKKADHALEQIDKIRSNIGSTQNQLESTIRNISVTQVNVAAAESQIRDVDFAAESANFAKHNILAQSGSYAMSQANAVQQNVMRLLQ